MHGIPEFTRYIGMHGIGIVYRGITVDCRNINNNSSKIYRPHYEVVSAARALLSDTPSPCPPPRPHSLSSVPRLAAGARPPPRSHSRSPARSTRYTCTPDPLSDSPRCSGRSSAPCRACSPQSRRVGGRCSSACVAGLASRLCAGSCFRW